MQYHAVYNERSQTVQNVFFVCLCLLTDQNFHLKALSTKCLNIFVCSLHVQCFYASSLVCTVPQYDIFSSFRIGTFFCPMLPVIQVIKLFILFYVKRVGT